MATNSPTECSICTEEYNENERCPRILPCFHTLCSSCILDIIRNRVKKCPFCVQYFQSETITDFKINNNVLDMLKFIKDLQSKGASSFGEVGAIKREMSKLNSKNREDCLNAQKKLKSFIDRNNERKKIFTSANRMIQNELIPKAMTVVSRNTQQILRLEIENKKIEDQLVLFNAKQDKLEEAQKKIDDVNTFSSAGPLMDEAKTMDTQLRVNWQALELLSENNEKLQKEINEASKTLEERMSSIMELLRSYEHEIRNSIDEDLNPFLDVAALTIQEAIRDHKATESLRERNYKMKQLIKQGMVYAKQEHDGKIRHALLSISNNKYLCIHHLQDKPVAPNSVLLQFQEAMRMVDPVSRLSFIELKSTSDDKVLGKLMIRLTHDTKRAKNFQLLCTGQEGPSYAETIILKVLNKGTVGEFVWMGDYESTSGKGGQSLVPGAVSEQRGVLDRPQNAGAVNSASLDQENLLSQFHIITHDKPGAILSCSFGYVEEGLQILSDAIQHYPDIKKVKISDCGMVLRTL